MQRLAVLLFGLRHLPKHKIVFAHGLVRSGGIWVGAEERVDGALGKQPAGAAEIIEQVGIIGALNQGGAEVCNCLVILPRLDLSDSEGLEGVNALQVRNGLSGVTQREQSVAELQVRGVQIGAQLDRKSVV